MEQWLSFEVFDKDTLTADDSLGSVFKLTTASLLERVAKTGEAELCLEEDGRPNGGHLVISAGFAPVASSATGVAAVAACNLWLQQ